MGSMATTESGLHHGTATGAPVVQDHRVLVERPADAVAAVFADQREPGGLRDLLHGVADVRDPASHAERGDARVQRLLGDLDQPSGLLGRARPPTNTVTAESPW